MTESFSRRHIETLPENEILRSADRTWLGGLFEIGGGMGFEHQQKKGSVYTYPYLQYTDNKPDNIKLLHSVLGCGQIREKGESWVLMVRGYAVVGISSQLAPFTPSRKNIIEAFCLWESETSEERVAIASQQKTATRTPANITSYEDLIRAHPDFTAGVIDARGIWYDHKRLLITSGNIMLLMALNNIFGGSVYVTNQNDDIPDGKEKSFTLDLGHSQIVENLLPEIGKNLRFSPNRFGH